MQINNLIRNILNNPKDFTEKEVEKYFKDYAKFQMTKCQCKKATFTRTVDADFNPLCGKCGKVI
jgi:RNA recognition motif-containing protein